MKIHDRETWLAGLATSDEVAISVRRDYRLGRVLRRTPSGRLVVQELGRTTAWEFNPDGYERGGHNTGWGRNSIEPVTVAIREGVERQQLLLTLSTIRWDALPLATLRRVTAALKEPAS